MLGSVFTMVLHFADSLTDSEHHVRFHQARMPTPTYLERIPTPSTPDVCFSSGSMRKPPGGVEGSGYSNNPKG